MTEYGSCVTYEREQDKKRDFTQAQERRVGFLIESYVLEALINQEQKIIDNKRDIQELKATIKILQAERK